MNKEQDQDSEPEESNQRFGWFRYMEGDKRLHHRAVKLSEDDFSITIQMKNGRIKKVQKENLI